jgi:RNA polymerase sigma-70 factor (ECF subfamily)
VTDAEILDLSDRLAKGDRAALDALFKRFAGLALAAALRVLRSRAEAEEVVQDAFLEAWRKAEHYQPERASFDVWIVTIARSRALDRLRTRESQARTAEAAGTTDTAPAPATDELLESRRLAHTLQLSVAQLPVDQRETLELAYRQGLSQSEIAARTGTPLGTVKTRMRLATRRLAEALGPLMNPTPHPLRSA